jgi:hypothetical protein
LKFIFYFMETTHKPLHSDKRKFGTLYPNIMDIPICYIRIIICLAELLNMAIVRNFEVMLGQTLCRVLYLFANSCLNKIFNFFFCPSVPPLNKF